MRVRPRAGRATAPATATPSMASATWTAQSVRPASLNSRVPSTGSTIQTRSCVEPPQVVAALLGQHRIAGSLPGQQVHQEQVRLAVAGVAGAAGVLARRPGARPAAPPGGGPSRWRPDPPARDRRESVRSGTWIAYQFGRDLR